MPANTATNETALIDAAVAWLRDRLPAAWSVERSQRASSGSEQNARLLDAAIELRASNGTFTTFAVELKRTFTPRDVDQLMAGLTRVLRTLAGNVPILVVAPWLSVRTQELLAGEGVNFIDLTGNARISIDNPALYIDSTGATRNPDPPPRGRAQVRGTKAARLVRLLADVRPPYGVRELAEAADVTPGYISRLLDTLDREALVDRSPKGRVESVDVAALLRRWAETYDVLRTNDAETFLAPNGAAQALAQLRENAGAERLAITGSFAAVRSAPIAAPALLLVYSDDIAPIVEALELLPAEQGANVALLRPFDPVVWERSSKAEGLRWVAPSQAAIDCLTGTGRMPSEGEALLAWMADDESRWRLDALPEVSARSEGQ